MESFDSIQLSSYADFQATATSCMESVNEWNPTSKEPNNSRHQSLHHSKYSRDLKRTPCTPESLPLPPPLLCCISSNRSLQSPCGSPKHLRRLHLWNQFCNSLVHFNHQKLPCCNNFWIELVSYYNFIYSENIGNAI